MPGQPVRTHARFRMSASNSPSRITSLPPASPQSFVRQVFENCHVCGEPTLRQIAAARNRKTFPPCAETVDDSTSLWKAEEN